MTIVSSVTKNKRETDSITVALSAAVFGTVSKNELLGVMPPYDRHSAIRTAIASGWIKKDPTGPARGRGARYIVDRMSNDMLSWASTLEESVDDLTDLVAEIQYESIHNSMVTSPGTYIRAVDVIRPRGLISRQVWHRIKAFMIEDDQIVKRSRGKGTCYAWYPGGDPWLYARIHTLKGRESALVEALDGLMSIRSWKPFSSSPLSGLITALDTAWNIQLDDIGLELDDIEAFNPHLLEMLDDERVTFVHLNYFKQLFSGRPSSKAWRNSLQNRKPVLRWDSYDSSQGVES